MQLAVLVLSLLHACLFAVPAGAVVVSTSQQFAQALLNSTESEILLAVPASNQPLGARLVLAPEDFDRVGPVRRSGVPLLVHPGSEGIRVNLDFNGLSSPIVLDYNASATFMGVGFLGFVSRKPLTTGTYSFVPELLTGASLVVYPGATIGLSDVNLYGQTGICLNFARDLEQALSAQFGASSVIELGPTQVRLVGGHEVSLPPHVTSTQPYGTPVMLILENVTYVCVPDRNTSTVPNVGPAFSPVIVSGSYVPDTGTVVAPDSVAVAAALRNTSVTTIVIGKAVDGGVKASTVVLQQADFPAPVTIDLGRSVNIISGSPANMSTLDFNNLTSTILLQPNATLGFSDLFLSNVPSPLSVDPTTYPYPASRFLWAWPAVVTEDDATVTLLRSQVDVRADCVNFRDVTSQQIMLLYGRENVVMANNHTLTLLGQHTSRMPIQDIKTGEQVGEIDIISDNATAVCISDPLLAPVPVPAPAMAESGGGSSNLGLILGLSLGLGLGAVAVAGALWAFLLLPLRRRRHDEQRAVEAAIALASNGTTQSNASGGMRTLARKSDESVDAMSMSPHGTLWQLRYLGPLEDEQVEIGPLLGRGGFGRVYKGRWKGAVVAIKVVDHVEGSQGVTTQQRMDRESLLATSLAHPNVVTTYKISTITSSGTPQTGRGTPEDTPMELELKMNLEADARERERELATHGSNTSSSETLLETWLVMEYCDRGSLLDAVRAGRFYRKADGAPDLLSMYRCLLDIATGMDYLHSAGIVHGDLKTANVLLKSTTSDARGFVCKLADFGLSRILTHDAFSHVVTRTYGTMAYMPPELLKTGKLARPTDVYSFGMVMFEVYLGEEPFAGMAVGQIFYKTVIENERPAIPDDCPQEYADMMNRCWSTDAAQRPTFPEIMKSLQDIWQRLRGIPLRKPSGGDRL